MLHLGEKCVETVHLLSLLYICVVLSYAAKGELVHKVYFIRRLHVFVLYSIVHWKGSNERQAHVP